MINIEKQNIEVEASDINKWCPMFGLPCYDRQLTEPFFMSFMKTVMYNKDIGLKFAVSTITDSLINRARNNLVAKFLANPKFTHLIFIDVDLEFEAQDILKMLWHDKEIITGSYPIKEINWDKVKEGAQADMASSDLMEFSTRYVVHLTKPGENQLNIDNGAIECYEAGTGFMVIKRQVFDKMFKKYKKLKYNDDTGALNGPEKENSYALFNSYVDDDGRFLSEDYGFCRYWQKMGGKIWVDPTINLTHFGRIKYTGKMLDYLKRITQ